MDERVRTLNDRPVRTDGAQYVIYWSQMNRRVRENHALVHAAELANELNLPLLYFERLTCGNPAANDRFWTFMLEGVPDTEAELAKLGIGYTFHLRARRDDPRDGLMHFAENAAAVITDDFPVFVTAKNNRLVAERLPIAMRSVQASTVIPPSRFEKREYAAYTFRPKVKKLLPQYLQPAHLPKLNCKWNAPPSRDWHTSITRGSIPALLANCDIDHSVPPSVTYAGGSAAAQRRLRDFLENRFSRYNKDRNQPSRHATSEMSPYLHFGHIGALDIALQVQQYTAEHQMMADEYLEELIVRRELTYNFAYHSERVDSLSQLPEWARSTLLKHATDRRDPIYSRETLETAQTKDPIWNAAQKELLLRGRINNYYRMYWGKKVIEWSPCCQTALEHLLHFHDRYALDGRDPNTYTNILWLFGLHDRPWSERPIFGTIRYMSYDGIRRKTDSKSYIEEISEIERTGTDQHRVS